MIDWTVRLRAYRSEYPCEPYWQHARVSVDGMLLPLAPMAWAEMRTVNFPIVWAGTANNDINEIGSVVGTPVHIAADDDRRRMRVRPAPDRDMVLDCTPPWAGPVRKSGG